MKKIMLGKMFFLLVFALVSVCLFTDDVFAGECGIDGMTTGNYVDPDNPSPPDCNHQFYCCDNKVYNACDFPVNNGYPQIPGNCSMITGAQIDNYNNGGGCPCGCNEQDTVEPKCYRNRTTGEYVVGVYGNNPDQYQKMGDIINNCNKLEITKVDSSGTQLSGAMMTLTGTNVSYSNVIKSIGKITLTRLNPGTYKLKEVTAPTGYQLDQTEVIITVASDGKISITDATNVYSRTTSATLNATLSISNTLEGAPACYKEKTGDGNYVVGNYNGNSQYDKISDDVTKCNKLVIKKVNSSGNQLSGATISITGPNNYDETKTVGSVTLERLSQGTYIIKEKTAPNGYQLDGTEITVTVNAEGNISVSNASNVYSRTTSATLNASLSISNTPEEVLACYKNKTTGDYAVGNYNGNSQYDKISDDVTKCNKLVIKKVDSSGKQLSGATIVVTGPNNYDETKTIGSVTLEKLSPGSYTIKETAGPTGYVLDQTEITFEVASDGKITINNASNVQSRTTTAELNAELSIKNVSEKNCYRKVGKDGNEYIISDSLPGDDWVEIGKEGEVDCDEVPACYRKGTDYDYGDYRGVDGYILVPDISEEDCHADEVVVPKTDMNVSLMIIVTMLILASIGVGFILYSRKMGKA